MPIRLPSGNSSMQVIPGSPLINTSRVSYQEAEIWFRSRHPLTVYSGSTSSRRTGNLSSLGSIVQSSVSGIKSVGTSFVE